MRIIFTFNKNLLFLTFYPPYLKKSVKRAENFNKTTYRRGLLKASAVSKLIERGVMSGNFRLFFNNIEVGVGVDRKSTRLNSSH